MNLFTVTLSRMSADRNDRLRESEPRTRCATPENKYHKATNHTAYSVCTREGGGLYCIETTVVAVDHTGGPRDAGYLCKIKRSRRLDSSKDNLPSRIYSRELVILCTQTGVRVRQYESTLYSFVSEKDNDKGAQSKEAKYANEKN